MMTTMRMMTRIDNLSGHALDRYQSPQKSHLFVPLSAYDITTALLLTCFCLSIYFISDLGNRFRIRTVSLDMEEIPIPG